METYLTIDLEERIRQYDEEKRKIEESTEEATNVIYNQDEDENNDDKNSYLADWYIG